MILLGKIPNDDDDLLFCIWNIIPVCKEKRHFFYFRLSTHDLHNLHVVWKKKSSFDAIIVEIA